MLDIWFTGTRQDWYAWAIREMTSVDYVLVIASPRYRQVGDGASPANVHKGVQSEAALLRDLVFGDRDRWLPKILPVVFEGHHVDDIPLFLQPHTATHYKLGAFTVEDAAALLRVIQRRNVRPGPPDGNRDRPSAPAAVMRTLPRDTTAFTGRTEELNALLAAVQEAKAEQVVAIHAIDGMAGIGKTAFAVHTAYLLAEHFPDGQLFLRLHTHAPGQTPVDPVDALGSLLTTVGVAAQNMPVGLDARAAMWRDHLVGKRILLILDDAANHQQVEPLLPASPGSLVLVTSRRRLTALDTTMTVPLDTLPPAEAVTLLVRLSARDFTDEDAELVADVVHLCGYLPLAISLLAGRLRHHRTWTVANLLDDLNSARDRLGHIRAEDVGMTVAFDLSYRNLPSEQQRFFRYLSLHPGAELDVYSAAALAGTSVPDARHGLDSLYDDHLINEPTYGRYRMHDLVREYARSLVEHDSVDDRGDALDRLMEYYLCTATAAGKIIDAEITRDLSHDQESQPVPVSSPRVELPYLSRLDEAWSWMHTECANLFACAEHAAGHFQNDHVIDLATAMAAFLESEGPWDQAITLHRAAVASARSIGNQRGTADALNRIAPVQHRMADYAAAINALTQALDLYREIGHDLGQVRTLIQLARTRRQKDDYAGAAEAYTQALAIARSLDDRVDEAYALNELGIIHLAAGNCSAAIDAHTQALGIFQDLGDRIGQADARNELGVAQRTTGDYSSPIALHEEAVAVYRDIGDGFHQALALNNLGTVWRKNGEHEKAIAAHNQAMAIARALGDRIGQANALNELGAAHRVLEQYPTAREMHTQALDLYRLLGHQLGMAETLNHEGTLLLAWGNRTKPVRTTNRRWR